MGGIDPAKLAEWFGDRAPGLVLYARQWLDPAAAEDVVQEVFVRLMAQPREPANLKAWLYLATRNAAIAAGRSGRRRTRRERAVAERRTAGAEPLFHGSAEDRIDAAEAEAALAQLSAQQREIVLLRIWGGMTLAEVAAVTGLALSTVYDHYRAALARVRSILESSCPTKPTPPAAAPTRRAPNPRPSPAGPPNGPITGAFRMTRPT